MALGFIAYQNIGNGPERTVQQAKAGQASIAVLPFVNMSNDPDQEFFSDGIAEELLNVLAGYNGLRVAARTSSFQFKGDNRDIGEIGQKLNVEFVLEGSVRKSGDTIRITAQLIEAATGFHMWSETYDRQLDDVFAIQDEISAAIGNELRSKLALGENIIAPTVYKTSSAEAYEEFLQGRRLVDLRGRKNLETAIEHFTRAVELDENYAPAYALMGISYGMLRSGPGWYGDYTSEEAYNLSKPYIDKAMALDPNLAYGHAGMGQLATLLNDDEGAIAHYDKALAINPSDMNVLNFKRFTLSGMGRQKEAMAVAEMASRLDPMNIIVNFNYGAGLTRVDRFDDARRVFERIKPLSSAWGNLGLTIIEDEMGNPAGMVEYQIAALKLDPKDFNLLPYFAGALSDFGFTEAALKLNPTGAISYYLNAGNFEVAMALANADLAKTPDEPAAIAAATGVYYLRRDFEGALLHADRLWEMAGGREGAIIGLNFFISYAQMLRMDGQNKKATEVFEAFKTGILRNREAGFVFNGLFVSLGTIELYEGNHETAIGAFEEAFERGKWKFNEYSEVIYDPVREHPRFQALLKRHQAKLDAAREAIRAQICADDFPDIGWKPSAEICEAAQ
jgi:TolB-like protein/Tfp pilus assembly protein PilF